MRLKVYFLTPVRRLESFALSFWAVSYFIGYGTEQKEYQAHYHIAKTIMQEVYATFDIAN